MQSDEDLRQTTERFKSLDNATIAQMMRNQGMNITEEQIEVLKNNVSPDTIKMARENFSRSKSQAFPSNPTPNMNSPFQGNLQPQAQPQAQPQSQPIQQPQMPNFPSMPNLQNMDFQSMIKFLKDNPEMMKMISPQLANMFGGKNGNPDLVMQALEKLLWIFSIPSRIKRFFTSFRGICIVILFIAGIIGFIYRK